MRGDKMERKKDVGGAIMDAFCDYGGADNVVTGLMAIAAALDRLANAIGRENRRTPELDPTKIDNT